MFFALFLATIDVKRNIFDLCTDTKDCYLAVIEVFVIMWFQKAIDFARGFYNFHFCICMKELIFMFILCLLNRTKTPLTQTQYAGCMKLAGRDLQRKRRRMRKIRFILCCFIFMIK